MKVLVALCGFISGFGLMIEASPAIKAALMNDQNQVHFVAVMAIGAVTACYAYFIKHLINGHLMNLMLFTGFGMMVYLTIFSAIFAENLTRGIGGHAIGYLIVYLSRFFYLELGEGDNHNPRPRPTMIRD